MNEAVPRYRLIFVVALALAITAAFLWMIAGFIAPLILAALFTFFLLPVKDWLSPRLGNRDALAGIVVTLLTLFAIIIPMLGLTGLLVAQAVSVSESVAPWVQQQVADSEGSVSRLLPDWLPGLGVIAPYEAQITSKLGEFAGLVGGYLINSLSRVTQGTLLFFLGLFVMLYAVLYFLRSGPALVEDFLACIPMSRKDKTMLAEQCASVVRATVKGTFIIGIIQGGLAGAAFAAAGLQGAVFWAAVMAILSIVPGVGAALVWVPAVLYLLAVGQTWQGIALAAWCAVVVGTADNVLRPKLVGKDTKMPDLLILLSTLGGLSVFGIVGIVIGPVIASIFISVWGIYRSSFSEALGETE